MMQQYVDIKENYPDHILFFRLGDFYEMFFEDAIIASKALEIALTGKSCGLPERAPMCGVPYHASEMYIAKLVDKGYKVAVCEQMEDPSEAKGLVKRQVVQIITPGTRLSQSMLDERKNNYLASIYLTDGASGFAFCDISTGEIAVTQFDGINHQDYLMDELVKRRPSEVLINAVDDDYLKDIQYSTEAHITRRPKEEYEEISAERLILSNFDTLSLQGLGLYQLNAATIALGSLLSYLMETQKQSLKHMKRLRVYDTGDTMSLDKSTIKNLELVETLFEKKIKGSLLGVLDRTETAMGSRELKKWITDPLIKSDEINNRLNAVEALTGNVLLRNDVRESLKGIYDLERLSGRVACGNANGRDLIALKNSISLLPDLKASLHQCGDYLLEKIHNEIHDLNHVFSLIDNSIVEDPPFTLREGGLIKQGYSSELDEMVHSIRDGREWIAGLEGTERQATGIKNLKVGFNKVFGYYIEVTKSNLDLVPDNYIRKQTLINSERYITPELKEVESVVLNAETKINLLEYELFQGVRDEIKDYIIDIQNTAQAISWLDVLQSFAESGSKLGYVKPVINDGSVIRIEKGRHPVIEETIRDGIFVSNDTYMDRDDHSMLLITGPNMAGKSTYMRQTALIVLMAQAGCFVPAERAEIGITDRIYTRIGASDNLAQGQSTFFVEMSELAYILNTATEKSLVILDEIGRGTSTYDGLSIAWAVTEHLCNRKRIIRTLFATHYHELTSLEGTLKGLHNLNVDVKEQDGNIIFLHKILAGSANRSYGIHVAKLAGVPHQVLRVAAEKLAELEIEKPDREEKVEEKQLSLFGFAPNTVVERLKNLNLMDITPSQAFQILEELKKAAME
ncbi:MAG: DNA mismatch repair protein MutS [Anaerovoracaceae bacterium]